MNQSRNRQGGMRRAACGVLCSASLLFMMGNDARAQSLSTRHVHQDVTNGDAPYLHRLAWNQSLQLSIMLPLRNEADLDDLLNDLYDERSPMFRQFLSVEEFTQRFGPSEEDYAGVIRFAKENGLKVTGTSANRMVVNVSGLVANIEKAFHVNIASYQHPTEQRTFYSADREPSPDLAVPIWHISGLDNFSRPRPMSLRRNAAVKGNSTGSGRGGEFIGSDFRAAYYGGTSLTGAGQSVGLVEFGGYNRSDVTRYFSTVGQALSTSVIPISTDGSSTSCTGKCDDTEQALDIEVAISIAPGMHQLRVYVSDTSDVSIFNRMATDNVAKSLSCSWGWSPADPASDDPIFKEFAAQGQTLFVASGDSGAYKSRSRFVFPADDANVISVGGTDLTTNGPGGSWKAETAWADSGGGISPNRIAIPNFQKAAGVITSANKGSTIYRNAPDVAAEANTDNFICYDGTCASGWGGTSFAAPRWAGYLALVNQQAVAHSKKTVGFIDPKLYSIGRGSSYATDFHDITSGNNRTYSAGKGYDLVTGWGSPRGTGLINALAP
jgi:subtilase family serine protease